MRFFPNEPDPYFEIVEYLVKFVVICVAVPLSAAAFAFMVVGFINLAVWVFG